MANIIIGAVVGALIGAAIVSVIKNRKSGACAHCNCGCKYKKMKN